MSEWAGNQGQPAGPMPHLPGVRAYCNEARVEVRNDGGWLTVEIEATDAIIGYAVSVNGKDLPYQPAPAEEQT